MVLRTAKQPNGKHVGYISISDRLIFNTKYDITNMPFQDFRTTMIERHNIFDFDELYDKIKDVDEVVEIDARDDKYFENTEFWEIL